MPHLIDFGLTFPGDVRFYGTSHSERVDPQSPEGKLMLAMYHSVGEAMKNAADATKEAMSLDDTMLDRLENEKGAVIVDFLNLPNRGMARRTENPTDFTFINDETSLNYSLTTISSVEDRPKPVSPPLKEFIAGHTGVLLDNPTLLYISADRGDAPEGHYFGQYHLQMVLAGFLQKDVSEVWSSKTLRAQKLADNQEDIAPKPEKEKPASLLDDAPHLDKLAQRLGKGGATTDAKELQKAQKAFKKDWSLDL